MSDPWPVHTLVFDLDDTLFAERTYVESGFRAADAWIARERGIVGFAATALRLFDAGRRGRIFDDTLAALQVTPELTLVAKLVEVYRAHRPHLQLLPDAREVLEWARFRFTLAVITDGYEKVQRLKVAALDLGAVVPTVIFTDAWGRAFWKPSPRAFEVLMAHDREAAGYVYVGDNPAKDFIAPRALGWRTVRVRRKGGEHADAEAAAGGEADFEIHDLTRLKLLLGAVPGST